MDNDKILAYLQSHDERLGRIEEGMNTTNHELGILTGKICEIKSSRIVPLLIKYVVFPLILIMGGLVGVKLLLPF